MRDDLQSLRFAFLVFVLPSFCHRFDRNPQNERGSRNELRYELRNAGVCCTVQLLQPYEAHLWRRDVFASTFFDQETGYVNMNT